MIARPVFPGRGRPAAFRARTVSLLGALILGVAGTTAGATPPPHPDPGGARPQLERRIGQLHAELHIRPDQEAAWNNLADTMRANAARTEAADEAWRNRARGTDAVAGLNLYTAIEQTDAANAAALQQPFSGLYLVLSPLQKRTADAMMARYVDAQTRRRS